MSGNISLVMGDRGRIVIPAPLRERYQLTAGTPIALIETQWGLELMTRDQLLARVRADCAGSDMLTDLFADRRREAELDAQ